MRKMLGLTWIEQTRCLINLAKAEQHELKVKLEQQQRTLQQVKNRIQALEKALATNKMLLTGPHGQEQEKEGK